MKILVLLSLCFFVACGGDSSPEGGNSGGNGKKDKGPFKKDKKVEELFVFDCEFEKLRTTQKPFWKSLDSDSRFVKIDVGQTYHSLTFEEVVNDRNLDKQYYCYTFKAEPFRGKSVKVSLMINILKRYIRDCSVVKEEDVLTNYYRSRALSRNTPHMKNSFDYRKKILTLNGRSTVTKDVIRKRKFLIFDTGSEFGELINNQQDRIDYCREEAKYLPEN